MRPPRVMLSLLKIHSQQRNFFLQCVVAFQETHFAYFLNAPKTSELPIETRDTLFNEIIELKSIEQDIRRFYHLVFQDKLEININATSPDGLFPP